MDSQAEREEQVRLLWEQQRRLRRLEMQIEQGGKAAAPSDLQNEIASALAEIARLRAELVVLEDRFEASEAPGAEPEDPTTEPPLPSVRVFISSTMSDMHDERDAVEQALKALDLQAVRAETVGAQSTTPLEACLAMAQECDIYLGIYGGRYGYVVPGDGRSVTEIEYQEAQKHRKPSLIYVKKGVRVEPEQQAFLDFAGDIYTGHFWRPFEPDDVPDNLIEWVRRDVRREIEEQLPRHQEWLKRPPARNRVLLASLGRSPGVVTAMYDALARAAKTPARVLTFSTSDRYTREAVGVLEEEFPRMKVSYGPRYTDAADIDSEQDAREYKDRFYGALQELAAPGTEVLVGITGGRTVMGALMATVVQTSGLDLLTVYHLDVDDDIEHDGEIPDLFKLRNTARWQEVLHPARGKVRLVQVPLVQMAGSAGK